MVSLRPDRVELLVEQANRLLDDSSDSAGVAELRAGLEALSPRELVRFDGRSRSGQSGMSARAITRLRWPLFRGTRRELWTVLALVSSYGRERQRAVEAVEFSPLTARLLAIRCTDWVAQVRGAAVQRLEQCPTELLIEALALADQLAAERLRGDGLDALLARRLTDDDLRCAVRARDRLTRRAAWRRLTARGEATFEALRHVAATDEDPVVRRFAASALATLPAGERRTLARALVKDSTGSVATPALAALVQLDGADTIPSALIGASAGLRRAAREWAALRGVDARAVYFARLRERQGDRVALTALAEIADERDAQLFRDMLDDARPRVQAAGLRALGAVDQRAARTVALDALRRLGTGRVARSAADVLRRGSLSGVELDTISQITLDRDRKVGERFRALALIRRNRWRHLAVILEARAAETDSATAARIDREVDAWIAMSRHVARGPDPAVKETIERLLDTLRPEQHRQIEFVLRTSGSA